MLLEAYSINLHIAGKLSLFQYAAVGQNLQNNRKNNFNLYEHNHEPAAGIYDEIASLRGSAPLQTHLPPSYILQATYNSFDVQNNIQHSLERSIALYTFMKSIHRSKKRAH